MKNTLNFIAFMLAMTASVVAQLKEFTPMEAVVDSEVSRIDLREKVRDVCELAIVDFLEQNSDRKHITVGIVPSLVDIDGGMASQEISALAASLGKQQGVKVVAPESIRKSLVGILVTEENLEGIIDQDKVRELGKQYNCDIMLTPQLKVLDEWSRKKQRVGIEMLIEPWDVETATRLASHSQVVELVAEAPQPSFWEENGWLIIVAAVALVALFLLMVIGRVWKKATRPR